MREDVLARVGHLVINLRYVVISEDADLEPPPRTLPAGIVRVTIDDGRTMDLRGHEADVWRCFMTEYATVMRPRRATISSADDCEPAPLPVAPDCEAGGNGGNLPAAQ